MTIVVHESIGFDFHLILSRATQLIDNENDKPDSDSYSSTKALNAGYVRRGIRKYIMLEREFSPQGHVFSVLGYRLFRMRASCPTIVKNR